MHFRIADTFTASLARLTGDEQKAVKTTAFDLQMDPTRPGLGFHKLDRAKDKRFSSVRVSQDLRLIVHRTPASLLLCYVGHHDDAYGWAERRRLETHPTTGAAQLVEVRERVQVVRVPQYVDAPPAPAPPLFADVSDEELLACGVPADWLEAVRGATDDTLLELAAHLPAEAAEALLDLATGTPPVIAPPAPGDDPFAHPDARRRFRTLRDQEELARALEYPWDRWTIFLHPAQRATVEHDFNGPARVAGSAGTGKTIVALHRAVFLARHAPEGRVLLTTFSDTLAHALRTRLHRLIAGEPRLAERIEVHAMQALGRRLYERNGGTAAIATPDDIRELIEDAARAEPLPHGIHFLIDEWREVVDAWQLRTWEAYRDVPRLGRRTRLPESRRQALWALFERVRAKLDERGLITWAGLFDRLAAQLGAEERTPFDHCVVDEAQDVSVPQLRFLVALAGERPNGLFFAGDLGQRIFQPPFSWKALGVDVRGRSRTLRINYRTSHQIREQADRLLDPEVRDVDGNVEARGGTQSVFNGPPPTVALADSPGDEIAAVAEWLRARLADGVTPDEIGVFVRSPAELPRAAAALAAAGVAHHALDGRADPPPAHAAVGTMPLAKGLEYRTVAVMACDEDVVPLQERIDTVADASDLEEVYNTERHLLYVACTRARDHLLVTGVTPGSEFVGDLGER